MLRTVRASGGTMELLSTSSVRLHITLPDNVLHRSPRCDTNVNVNKGGRPPGARCKIKGLESVKFTMVAISTPLFVPIPNTDLTAPWYLKSFVISTSSNAVRPYYLKRCADSMRPRQRRTSREVKKILQITDTLQTPICRHSSYLSFVSLFFHVHPTFNPGC